MAIYDLAYPDATPYPTIPLGTTTVSVSSSNALSTALANAVPGQRIVLTSGSYSGAFSIEKAGTAAAGISIESATPGGAAFAAGSTFRLTNCAYVTVSGIALPFDGAGDVFQFRGTSHHCRLTRATFGPTTHTASDLVSNWIYVGDDCHTIRIDHNRIRNKGTSGNGIRIYGNFDKVDAGQGSSAGCRWVRIDHNIFKTIKPEVGNDKEPVRYGVSTMSRTIANGVIERNYFEDCICEPELVSVKMTSVRVTGNTFYKCAGGPVIRHGTNSALADNYVVDDPIPAAGIGGGTPPPAQTLGVGGVTAPSGAILTTADSTAALNITTSGTATSPRVYDGQGHTVGRINVTASYVTVQNFRINANSQYGALLDGNNIVFQNNDIKGLTPTGDGDLNAITAFGNNLKIKYNTAINFVGVSDPGASHTDFIQTWVSSSHPVASANWEIVGNKAVGPSNPSRLNSIASIHQCVMAEGLNRGGNSGGNGDPNNWLIADNEFSGSWNQECKLDGVDNVNVTRNRFTGSSDKVMDVSTASTNVRFYADNTVGSGYGSVGVSITPGSGPTSL